MSTSNGSEDCLESEWPQVTPAVFFWPMNGKGGSNRGSTAAEQTPASVIGASEPTSGSESAHAELVAERCPSEFCRELCLRVSGLKGGCHKLA
eukprot:2152352-Amphidinium_carterae.3